MPCTDPTFPEGNPPAEDRAQRSLAEIGELAALLRRDLALAASTCDAILAEVTEGRTVRPDRRGRR